MSTRKPSGVACPNITDRYFYFDVVRFWLGQRLSDAEENALRETGLKLRRYWLGSREPNRKLIYGLKRRHGWKCIYQLEQPDAEGLRRLSQMLDPTAQISYLEIAVEFITDDEHERQRLHRYLDDRLWQGHRSRREPRHRYLGTVYTGSRDARNRMVLYSDRHSKMTGELFCTNLELWLVKISNTAETLAIRPSAG